MPLVFLSRDAPGPFSLSTVRPGMSRGFPCNSECAERAAPPLPLITDMLLCERLLVTIKVPCDIGMRGFAPVIRHLDTHHTPL